jgi:general secretion pathway protein E
MNQMNELVPAFELISFADAVKRDCAVLRNAEGQLFLVFADPFQADVQQWAEARMPVTATWHLVHRADLAAYFARHEDSMVAMESVLQAPSATAKQSTAIEHLSLKTINEHTSPVIKLVQSTMYDALKANASDIHLECEPVGCSSNIESTECSLTLAASKALSTPSRLCPASK